MLIIALVLAAIGLAALVFAVVTSNALVAWVCIGASLLGVGLLIVDALRERRGQGARVVADPVADDTRTAVDDVDDVEAVDDLNIVDDLDAAPETSEGSEPPATLGEAISGGFDAEAIDETAEKPAAQPAD